MQVNEAPTYELRGGVCFFSAGNYETMRNKVLLMLAFWHDT